MAYPKNLRVAVDKKNTYVPSDGWQKPYYGNLIEEGGIQHDILCRLTDRVISALKTRRAHAALQEIAEGWRRQYKPDLNAAKAAADFQKLLDDPSDDHRFWATIIIAWKMAPQVGGGHLRKTPLNVEEPEFLFSFQYIGLNGVRIDLARQDYEAGNPEWHMRWFELFWTYCHECAHMFVTYLSKTYRDNIECKTPDTLRTPYTKIATGGEAGEVFESVFWGGAIVRSPDGSGRNPINMTGILGLRNSEGTKDISFARMVNLTTKTTNYVDDDFDLQAYWPVELKKDEDEDPIRIHEKFFRDFKTKFGPDFAPRKSYSDSSEFPARLGQIATSEVAHRYDIQSSTRPGLVPLCCRRMVCFQYGGRVYVLTADVAKKLKEHSDRSAARLPAHKGKSSVQGHNNQCKITQATSITKNASSRRQSDERYDPKQFRRDAEGLYGHPDSRSLTRQSSGQTASRHGKPSDRPLPKGSRDPSANLQVQPSTQFHRLSGGYSTRESSINPEYSSRRPEKGHREHAPRTQMGQLSEGLRITSLSSSKGGRRRTEHKPKPENL